VTVLDRTRKPLLSLTALLLVSLLAQACSSAARPGEESETSAASPAVPSRFVDDEEGRTDYLRHYFGGEASFGYLKFKTGVASAEVKRLRNGLTASGPAWVNLGPTSGAYQATSADPTATTTGRLTGIVTHPTNSQIVYIATAGGGVFKTTNASLTATTDWTWTPITDNLPASSAGGEIAVGAIAMSPTDPNTLFIGMGDPYFFGTKSLGLFITHDGGTTWTAGGLLGTSTSSQQMVALDSNNLIVAASAGLFRSTDGGLTFTAATIKGNVLINQAGSITLFPDGTLVASGTTSSGGQIFYSTDHGASWSLSTITGNPSGNQDYATVAPAATGTTGYALLASFTTLTAGVFKTTDSGKTFNYVTPNGVAFPYGTPAVSDTGQGMYNMLITVDPADATHLWVGTQNFLYRSLDSGATWVQASNYDTAFMHGDFHCAAWSKTGTKTLFVGNDGGLSVVKDPLRATIPAQGGGTTDLTYVDNRHNRGVASHLVYNIGSTFAPIVTDAHSRVSIGIQDDGVRVRTDTGSGLSSSGTFDETEGGDGFATIFHPYLPDLLLGGYQNHLLRAVDGRTIINVVMPPSTGPAVVMPFGIFLHADQSDPSGNGVLTLGQSIVYRSHDFGLTFTALSQNGYPSDFYVYAAAVAPTEPNTVALAGDFNGGFGAGFLSLDNGATWTQMGAIGATARARFVWFDNHNSSIIYLSAVQYDSTHHLWKSTDKGKTFTALDNGSNGLPNGIPVYLVKSDPIDGNLIYAGTDLGLYRSADGGSTWTRYGSGLPMVAVRDLWVAPDGSLLRVGTFGRGAWELPLGRVPNTVTAAITTPSADQTIISGTSVSFSGTVTSSGSGATTQGIWLFDDNTYATGLNVSHTFTTNSFITTAKVTFIGTDSSGASSGMVRTITVQPAPDFSLAVSNSIPCTLIGCHNQFKQAPGSTGTGTLNVASVTAPMTVALSVQSGLPAGTTLTLNPTTVTSGAGSAALTLNVGASTAPGSYTITLQGVGASGTHTAVLRLTVTAPPSVISNGDFETGSLSGWTSAGSTSISTTPHGGSYAARVGSTSATNGDSSISQSFTAPSTGGTLSFWYNVNCPDSLTYDWATATLVDTTASTTTTVLAKTCNTSNAWKQVTSSLVGGHNYTLTLVSHDDGAAQDPTYTDFDDVAVTASTPPPPSPLVNGDFEAGTLNGWSSTGSASIVSSPVHGGGSAVVLGVVGQPSKDSTLAQTFTAPSAGGTLSFWYQVVCNDTVTYDWATATLKDVTAGTTSTILAKSCSKSGAWTQVTAALVANHSYTLTLANHDDNYAGDETYTYFDDVAVK
jgi:hypothetical protein